MNLYTIDTGYFKLDGGAMFGVVPKSIWEKLNPPDARNLCDWALRCLLVEEGDRLVLVDTGLGNKQSQRFFSHYEPHGDATLEGSLKAHGFSPRDVTDVFLTHLHFDHCGDAIRNDDSGKPYPTFPNATYWSHPLHWDWAMNPNSREKASFLKENFQPLQEWAKLKFLDEGSELFPGFTVRVVNGHTEGMMLPQISYRNKTLVYMADLMPSVAHIPVPYVMAYDVRPLVTMDEKKQFLDQAVSQDYVLFFEHDRVSECCTLVSTERGVRADETFKLADWG
jgi:glyoxylase-like metal-dependent hydrolase (beta-lactamase superfamily II)